VRRFHTPICRCKQCSKRVQGRHSLQTSDHPMRPRTFRCGCRLTVGSRNPPIPPSPTAIRLNVRRRIDPLCTRTSGSLKHTVTFTDNPPPSPPPPCKPGVCDENVWTAAWESANGTVSLSCNIPGGQSCALSPTSAVTSGTSLMTGPILPTEIRTSSSMRGCRKRATARRACALLYRSPWLYLEIGFGRRTLSRSIR
jgi:hypothetical protein